MKCVDVATVSGEESGDVGGDAEVSQVSSMKCVGGRKRRQPRPLLKNAVCVGDALGAVEGRVMYNAWAATPSANRCVGEHAAVSRKVRGQRRRQPKGAWAATPSAKRCVGEHAAVSRKVRGQRRRQPKGAWAKHAAVS
jgi:hypothetical protein